MRVLSKWMFCLAMPLLLLACSTLLPAAVAQREHYDPAYLNEAAMTALAAGERGTAAILLERAAVLAPQNTLIRDNLAALRQGGVVRVMPAVSAQAASVLIPTPAPASKLKPPVGSADEPALPATGIWPVK